VLPKRLLHDGPDGPLLSKRRLPNLPLQIHSDLRVELRSIVTRFELRLEGDVIRH